MPKITNPITIAKIKQGILVGKPDNQVLIEAGLSKQTANHKAKECKILKVVKSRIIEELEASDITVKLVINNLYEDRELARKKNDIATMKECDIWLGKYLAMFTEKSEVTEIDKQDNQFSLDRLSRISVENTKPSQG